MAKKQFNIRINNELLEYVLERCENEGKTQAEFIEELLRLDQQKKKGYVDQLANEIYKRLDDRLKSIRIAVNENNKLLKIDYKAVNYLLLAQNLKMPYDQYPDFTHPALMAATEEVKKEIKELQVIKATQRKQAQERKREGELFESSE